MIQGDPLSCFIYNGHYFTEDDVKNIIFQLLTILNELHNPIRMEDAIVHRDLRLSNLLIKNDKLYLIDFGFARYLHPNKSEVLPDPAFNSQEELDPALKGKTLRKPGAYTYRLLRRKISPRSDLFGTGVVAIDLFTNWVKDEELFNQPWEQVLPLSDQFTRFLQKLLSGNQQGFSSSEEALIELGNIR
jgi:serine/threonine protein kinase